MSDYRAELLAALQAAGVGPAKGLDLVGDGRLVRYRVDGDKPGSLNGWVVFHGGAHPAAAFGSWRTGAQQAWRPARDAGRPFTPAEAAARRQQLVAMEAARREEMGRVHADARARAAKLWARSRPATNAHAYLQRKRVHAFGLRRLGGALVVPLRDAAGTLHSLQFIQEDGRKTFLSGGRIRGCYFAIGRPDALLLVCEGYATGATLHMATGQAVAVAFNAGNLAPAARMLRAKFPGARMAICADDDRLTPGNPGVTRAREAARAVGARLIVPRFEE